MNGHPVEILKIKADGTLRDLTFSEPKLEQSGWVAARIFPGAHSNPITVRVGDKPVSVKSSAEWCLASVEQCWREKEKTYAPPEIEQAKADYEHARQFYRRLLEP